MLEEYHWLWTAAGILISSWWYPLYVNNVTIICNNAVLLGRIPIVTDDLGLQNIKRGKNWSRCQYFFSQLCGPFNYITMWGCLFGKLIYLEILHSVGNDLWDFIWDTEKFETNSPYIRGGQATRAWFTQLLILNLTLEVSEQEKVFSTCSSTERIWQVPCGMCGEKKWRTDKSNHLLTKAMLPGFSSPRGFISNEDIEYFFMLEPLKFLLGY